MMIFERSRVLAVVVALLAILLLAPASRGQDGGTPAGAITITSTYRVPVYLQINTGNGGGAVKTGLVTLVLDVDTATAIAGTEPVSTTVLSVRIAPETGTDPALMKGVTVDVAPDVTGTIVSVLGTAPAQTAPTTAARDANLRDGPGLEYAIINTVAADQQLNVVGQAQSTDDQTWYQLASGEWIIGLLVNNPPANAPEATPGAATSAPLSTATATPTVSAGEGQAAATPAAAGDAACTPSLEFTSVPAYGEGGNLEGRVNCTQADDYKVAIYIYVRGWWTKPTFAEPLTAVQRNGVWAAPIANGGDDRHATKIAAFLVPTGFFPPAASGAEELPNAIYDNAVASQEVSRGPDSSPVAAAPAAASPVAALVDGSISFEVTGETVKGKVAPPEACTGGYKVALYAYTNHWWVQPYADERRNIEINDDCTWSATTNQWTQLAAHLVTADLDLKPELFSEATCPPPPLDPAVDPDHVIAYKCTE